MPDIIEMAVAFADTDLTETVLSKQRATGCVGCDHLSLQHPVFFSLGQFDQTCQQGRPDPLPLCVCSDIDADLSDPGGASRVRNG